MHTIIKIIGISYAIIFGAVAVILAKVISKIEAKQEVKKILYLFYFSLVSDIFVFINKRLFLCADTICKKRHYWFISACGIDVSSSYCIFLLF